MSESQAFDTSIKVAHEEESMAIEITQAELQEFDASVK